MKVVLDFAMVLYPFYHIPVNRYKFKTGAYTVISINKLSENNLADEADLANETADRWLSRALANASASGPSLTPKGQCYFCEHEFNMDDPVERLKLFCDSDCSSDYEREQRLKARR